MSSVVWSDIRWNRSSHLFLDDIRNRLEIDRRLDQRRRPNEITRFLTTTEADNAELDQLAIEPLITVGSRPIRDPDTLLSMKRPGHSEGRKTSTVMLNTKSKVLLLRHTVLHSYIRRIGKKQLVINCECLQLCNVKYSRQCPTDGYHTRIQWRRQDFSLGGVWRRRGGEAPRGVG